MPTRERRPPMYVAALCLAAVAVSCLYDPNDRCAAGQQLDENDVCVCLPGHVPVKRDITIVTPTTGERVPAAYCAPCGENQVVSNDTCVCRPGYIVGPNGCVPSNIGTSCTGDADCASGDAKFCRLPEGYCTSSGCVTNADCSKDADYACATDPAAGKYCKRPPLKQGAPCSTQGMDPVCGTEAPICALGACTVLGCMVDTDCSPSRKCCDLSRFSPGVTLCLGVCP